MSDYILIKFMLGESSGEEATEVQKWIEADEKNEKYYKDFKLIWETSKRFAVASTIDEKEAWNNFKQKREALKETRVVPIRSGFSWFKIAASILLLIVAGIVFYTLSRNDGAVASIKIQSSDKILIETLSDGSVVTLNKNSILIYPEKFKGNKREIELEKGEAFFNVTPDKAKPFLVNVHEVTVSVVGTSFNIKEEPHKTEVIVETGIVSVSKKETVVTLEAREKLAIKKTDEKLTKEKNTDQLHNYYRTKQLVADNTPLWRVVEVLNEAYSSHIVIEGDHLKNLPLTTTFKLDYGLNGILTIISETFSIEVVRSKDQIILK